MGFGLLFLGYLVTFVLYLVLNRLGVGSVGLLLGVLLMLAGSTNLSKFQKNFRYSTYILCGLLLPSIYQFLVDFAKIFAFQINFPSWLQAVYEWSLFGLLMLLQGSLLFGVYSIAKEVALPKIMTASFRNGFLVAAYAVLYLLAKTVSNETVTKYLSVPVILLQISWIALNLVLFLNCAKDICPAGDEEIAPKDSKIGFLNRLRDGYDATRQKAFEKTKREAAEASLRKKKK